MIGIAIGSAVLRCMLKLPKEHFEGGMTLVSTSEHGKNAPFCAGP
jgi:hypothetical protein